MKNWLKKNMYAYCYDAKLSWWRGVLARAYLRHHLVKAGTPPVS